MTDVAGDHRGVEPVQRAHVLVAEVDVDEGCDAAVREDLRGEGGVAVDEVVEHLADGVSDRLDLTCAADLGPQRGGNADGDHACTGPPEQNST